MAAQASLLAGTFQPEKLLQRFAPQHVMCWTLVQFLPSYTQERVKRGTHSLAQHLRGLTGSIGGTCATHPFVFSSLSCSAAPVHFLIVPSSENQLSHEH